MSGPRRSPADRAATAIMIVTIVAGAAVLVLAAWFALMLMAQAGDPGAP